MKKRNYRMLVRNLRKKSEGKRSEQLKCVWCGNDASKYILPKLCDDCFEKGCKAF